MWKRIVSMVLVLALAVTLFPVTARASSDGSGVGSDVTLEGDTSFGSLLTNTVNASQTQQSQESYDSRICDMTVEGTTATVEYSTTVEANLVVAIYTEDGSKLLGSGVTPVSPEETVATVEIEISAMPYYFKAGAYLLDAQTNDPVSGEFKTDRYTKTMQDILAATVDDFNPELVLNLDNDRTTNFAVFNENTLLAESGDSQNRITDNGDGTYTIENADERFLAMQPGDTFAYTYPDGTVLIVNAASVSVSGTTVTVTDNPDADLSMVFDFVKIEEDSYDKDIEYDPTSCDEGITPTDSEASTFRSPKLMDVDLNVGASFSQGFKISKEVFNSENSEVKISGSFTYGLTFNLTVYISHRYVYVELGSEYTFTIGLDITGKLDVIDLELGDLNIPMFTGVYARVTPHLIMEASAELSATASVSGSIGIIYDSDSGGQTPYSDPTVTHEVALEGKLFIGFEAEVGLDVIHKKILSMSAKKNIGVEISAEKAIDAISTVSSSVIHECDLCFEGDVSLVTEESLNAIFLNSWSAKVKLNETKIKLFDFYLSVSKADFGKGQCPYKHYKTSVMVKDQFDVPLDAQVKIYTDGEELNEVYRVDSNGNPVISEIPRTDENGEVFFYLPNGEYTLIAEHEARKTSKDFTVYQKTKSLSLTIKNPTPSNRLTLSQLNVDMNVPGETLQMNADFNGIDVTRTCRWESSDIGVVKVTDGVLTPISGGTASVYVGYTKDGNTYLAQCEVTVTELAVVAQGTCGKNMMWVLDDRGTLHISGSGKMEHSTEMRSACKDVERVVLGSGVESISYGDFSTFKKLTQFEVADENPWLTSVGGVVFSKDKTALIRYPTGRTGTYIIPSGVTTIEYCAFEGSQLSEVVANDELTVIGSSAFSDSSVKTVVLPTSLREIGSSAFSDCWGIKTISLPTGVTKIGSEAFKYCWNVTEVKLPDSVTELGASMFYGCRSLTYVQLPTGLTCIPDGMFEYCTGLTAFAIPEGITTIGEDAFANCDALSSVVIPSSVSGIGDDAFRGCDALKNVEITDLSNWVKINFNHGSWPYSSCSNPLINGGSLVLDGVVLTDIVIPEGVTAISACAFTGCTLNSVIIPSGVTEIGSAAFSNCVSLKTVSFPQGLKTIGEAAFDGCEELSNVTLPQSVNSIGAWAFNGCGKISSITIPPQVTILERNVFSGTGVTELTIPYGVTHIYPEAFYGCHNLTSITIPTSVVLIEQDAFSDAQVQTVSYQGTREQWLSIWIAYNDFLSYDSSARIICTDYTFIPGEGWVINDAAAQSLEEDISHDPSVAEPTEAMPTVPPTEAPTEPVTEPTTEPTAEPTTEPLTEPAAEPEAADAPTAGEVSDIQWYMAPAGAKMTVQPVLQRLSAFTGTESSKNGMRSVKFTGLEPGEEYVLIVSIVPGSLVPADLQYIDQDNAAADGTLSFTYIPREDVSATVQLYGIPAGREITLDREYITLEAGAAVQKISASVTPLEWQEELVWSAENPEGTQVISVNEYGDVTPIAPGTAYAVATVTHGAYTFSARCRVDVTEKRANLEVTGVQLGTAALTTELFSTQYASFDVVLLLKQNMTAFAAKDRPEDNGVSVTSARFEDEGAEGVFDLVVKDDRTLEVVPKQTAIRSPGSVLSSYTSKVVVNVCGAEYVTADSLKLTVKKTLPKLKAASLTFNSFYTGQSQSIVLSGATATGFEAEALPQWLSLSPEGVLTLTDSAPAKSASGKANVLVQTQEWAIPTAVSVPVKIAYKAPALKLSASSVTIPTFANPDDYGDYGAGQWVQLLCKNKTDTPESLNVSWIEAPEGWYPRQEDQQLSETDGWFFLKPVEGRPVVPGKITLKVHFYGTDAVVELPLTIKTTQVPLAVHTYLTSAKLSLNSTIEDGFFVPWYVGPQYVDLQKYELTWDLLDKWGNSVKDTFNTFIMEDGRLAVLTTERTEPGTYELYLDLCNKETKARKTEESTVLKITVLPKSAKPVVSIKALDVIDFTFPNPQTRISFSFKNFFISRVVNLQYTVLNGKEDVTDQFSLSYDNSIYSWVLTPKGEVPTGSYTLNLSVRMDAKDPSVATAECSTKFTVKRTAVKLKLSKTSLSLNKAIGDTAAVTVSCTTKGYDLTKPVIWLMDSTGKNSAEGCLDLAYSSGCLTVGTNDATRYGATYKLLIQATAFDKPVTLTVKIPAQQNSKVTASLKASGAIDVIRDASSVTVRPTYKNYAGLTPLEKVLTIFSSADGKTYTEDVTSRFCITPNADGSYTVAKLPGEQLNAALKYRAVLTLPGVANSDPAYVSLPVKSGSAPVKLSGTAVLYKNDRFSRSPIPITVTDGAMNPISRVEIKDPKLAQLYEVYSYGNGEFAIGFKNDTVGAGVKSGNVALEVYVDGNASAKSNASVTLKLNIR